MYHYNWAWTDALNEVSWPIVVIAGFATLLLLQSATLLRLATLSGRARRADERVDRLNEVITLLTETSELGFKSVAAEVERLSVAAPRRASKGATSRITRSARQGRSIATIAADEQLAQSEVRLRLGVKDPALLERLEAEGART